MSTTPGGITYHEALDSGSTSGDRKTAAPVRRFFLEWEDHQAFLLEVLGYTEGAGGVYTVVKPWAYKPGSAYYANRYDLKGIGCQGVDSDGNITFAKARMTIVYGPPDEGEDEDEDENENQPWVEMGMQSHTQMQIVGGMGLEWVEDSVDLERQVPYAVPVAFSEMTLVRYNVGSVNTAALIAAGGAFNSTTFWGYPKGRLLFQGHGKQKVVNTAGIALAHTLTVKIKACHVGWDYKWRPGVGWREVRNTDGSSPFTYVDFATL